MPTPFPIVFAQLPTGLQPMELFDLALLYARTPSYFQPSGAPQGVYGDATHSAVITIGENGTVVDITEVPITGGGGGNTVIETGNGPYTVAADTSRLVLNRAVGGNSVVNLGAVAARGGLGLSIVDWAGNAGQITVNPNGAETIMGLPVGMVVSVGQGIGAAGLLNLTPDTTLNGWIQT